MGKTRQEHAGSQDNRAGCPVLYRAILLILVSVATGTAGVPGGPRCNTIEGDCSKDVCWVSCSAALSDQQKETEIRAAIHDANACNSNPTFERDIWIKADVDGNGDPLPCAIGLTNDETSACDTATGACTQGATELATCGAGGWGSSQPQYYGICLTGHDVRFWGSQAELYWLRAGTAGTLCDSDLESSGPFAFGIYGMDNWVVQAKINFFQEGLDIRGTRGLVEINDFQFYCDEAVTIEAGTVEAVVNLNRFFGHMASPKCALDTASSPTGTCGSDKAIQVNAGSGNITSNWFENARAPVRVRGTATDFLIDGNHAHGTLTGTCTAPFSCTHRHFGTPANSCSGFEVDAGRVTFSENEMALCKFGLDVTGTAEVHAISNTMVDNYVSGFWIGEEVEKPTAVGKLSKVRAEGNRVKGAGHGPNNECEGRRTAVTAMFKESPSGAKDDSRIDFGGGDGSGLAALSWVPGVSPGGNVFCQREIYALDGQNHKDMRNNNESSSCKGGNVSFGARFNCFERSGGPQAPGVGSTAGATSNCDCSFTVDTTSQAP